MDQKAEVEQHDADEAQRRFEKLVRTALNTPPKPMKDMPRKRAKEATKRGKADKAQRRAP